MKDTITTDTLTVEITTYHRHIGLHQDGDTIEVWGNWSSGAALTGKDAWLRLGTSGGEFVHREDDLSRSGRSGTVSWDISDAKAGETYTGKFRGDRFTIKVSRA